MRRGYILDILLFFVWKSVNNLKSYCYRNNCKYLKRNISIPTAKHPNNI